MIFREVDIEENAAIEVAKKMCAAARTAPKSKGVDDIYTLVLTGEDKDELADKMAEVYLRDFGKTEGHYVRDGKNVKAADAVVLIGVKKNYLGLPNCSLCGQENCGVNKGNNGVCAMKLIDLGIAIGSAVSVGADNRVDSRVMFSVGKVAEEMHYVDEEDVIWQGIPVSVTGKSPFFDRDKVRQKRERR